MNDANDFEVLFDNVDKKLKKIKDSDKAPAYFLENEIRREINRYAITYFINGLDDVNFLRNLKKGFEDEFECYFKTEDFVKKVRPSHWWQNVYAGCNAQIEGFLVDNGFAELVDKLGLWKPFQPISEIAVTEVPENLGSYLVGIGYFYPKDKETFILHPNVVMAQVMNHRYSGDSPFLSRDLIRCPYGYVEKRYYSYNYQKLSNNQLWKYWCDLVALSLADLPEYNYYTPQEFLEGGMEKVYQGWQNFNNSYKDYLEVGRKLVPQRYTELEPVVERFDWIDPTPFKEIYSRD